MRALVTTIAAGALALIAGFVLVRTGIFTDRSDVGRDIVGEPLTASGSTELEPPEAGGIHPALLRELRRLEGLASGRLHASLGTADFPEALFAAQSEIDYAAMDSLFRRWTEVDREGMLQYFFERGAVTLPSGNLRYDDLSDSLFKALAADDPGEAVRVALRFPKHTGYMDRALSVIAESSPERAVEAALAHLGQWEPTGWLDLGPEGNRALARAMAGRESFGKEERGVFQGLLRNGQPSIREDLWHALSREEQVRAVVGFVPREKDAGAVEREIFEAYRTRIESGLRMNRIDMNYFFSYYAGDMIAGGGMVGALDWVETYLGSAGLAAGAEDLLTAALHQGESIESLAAGNENLPPGPAKEFLKARLTFSGGGK